MCRLLLIKSKKPQNLLLHLQAFADIAKTSGKTHPDGWGIAYKDEQGKWKTYKSLKSIWQDQNSFAVFPKTTLALVHARKAYKAETIKLSNNHPFKKGKWFFAFNGNVRGIKIKASGSIGAKKIFNLLLEQLKKIDPERAIKNIMEKIEKYSRYIMALNFILTDGSKHYVYCRYSERPENFTLRYSVLKNLTIVCSEAYSGYKFNKMRNKELLIF